MYKYNIFPSIFIQKIFIQALYFMSVILMIVSKVIEIVFLNGCKQNYQSKEYCKVNKCNISIHIL